MDWQELTAIAATFVVSLGGGGAIVLGLANWIGRILANKYVEGLKLEIQQELESQKTRLRKSEFLFQKEFEAASTFISLHLRLLPREGGPYMGPDDDLLEFAASFETVERELESYIAAHGAALQPETLNLLSDAKMTASMGKFADNYGVSDQGVRDAKQVMESLEEVEQKLRRAVWSQSGT